MLTGLRGTVVVRTEGATLAVAAGEVASFAPTGGYELLNDGPGPASVLFSTPSANDLPRLVPATGVAAESLAYDTSGPLRLVSMRARRAAEKVR
jgi:hypothetical protein